MSSVSINVARAWAEAAFTVGHQMGVENKDVPEVNIDDYRPKRGKKSSGSKKSAVSPKKSSVDSSSLPFDESRCDARVWNGGYGAQCSKSHATGSRLCALHNNQLTKSLDGGGSDLRCGCWSKERPNRTLDGKDELIKWKDASLAAGTSKCVSKVGEHPKPRGPPPKSECGGKKVWNGEIGQWEDPMLSGSDTEDMTDDDSKEVAEKKVVKKKVVENKGSSGETEVGVDCIDGKYYKVTETSKIVQNENGSETEIISTHFTQTESETEPMEPESEPESEPEPEPESVPDNELEVGPAEMKGEVESHSVEVKKPQEEVVSEKVEGSSSTQDKEVVNSSPIDELGIDSDEGPTYNPGSPRDCETSIDGDKLTHQGVGYMFDADDGMIYNTESYDDVGKYCTVKMTVIWKSKKHEIAHMKEVSGLESK